MKILIILIFYSMIFLSGCGNRETLIPSRNNDYNIAEEYIENYKQPENDDYNGNYTSESEEVKTMDQRLVGEWRPLSHSVYSKEGELLFDIFDWNVSNGYLSQERADYYRNQLMVLNEDGRNNHGFEWRVIGSRLKIAGPWNWSIFEFNLEGDILVIVKNYEWIHEMPNFLNEGESIVTVFERVK